MFSLKCSLSESAQFEPPGIQESLQGVLLDSLHPTAQAISGGVQDSEG